VAIAFSCECGAKLTVPEGMAGKKSLCPTCRKPLVAPAQSTPDTFGVASSDLSGSRDLAISDAVPGEKRDPAKAKPKPSMRFRCPTCKKTLTVPLSLAGQTGKCGACGSRFQAPVPEQIRERMRAAATAPAPSLRDAFSIVKVRCSCGMTSSVPRARAVSGDERCPACERRLDLESAESGLTDDDG
jgi:hypothetical protein